VAVFATIVLYDAIGIRYAVGQQARFLNDLVGRNVDHLAFKEHLGHTPQEVIAGAVLGVIVASLFFR
ncbi:Integral membrane protein, partial [mine drainage metagenome]